MEERIIIEIDGFEKMVVPYGITLEEIKQKLNIPFAVAALVNNEVEELSYELKNDAKIKFLTIYDRLGNNIYLSGLKFLYITSVKEVLGKEVNVYLKHSIDKGIYTEIDSVIDLDKVNLIKEKMKKISEEDIKIKRITTTRKNAISYFEEIMEEEKAENYRQKTSDVVTLYSLLDYYDYFYTAMPISTKVLSIFDLTLTDNNAVILRGPNINGEIDDYIHLNKVLNVFKDYSLWTEKLNVNYVSDVNKYIINGRIKEFIQLNELKQLEELEKTATYIEKNINTIKVVLVAGPSSSGKTTTSKRLALELKSKGVNPFIISLDNYFLNRVDTPKNEKGEYLFDRIDAIDIDLFNSHLKKLLNNEEVKLPEYNFITGEKEYKREAVSLKNRDILIIEGIHALNEKLTKNIDDKSKYKIYVSPFTPLALDRHNHISTVDLRLIRLLVRDNRTRGRNALESLKAWRQVRDSEEKYIFPYQKDADVIINTALIYELGMLKTYAVPLLKAVNSNTEFKAESARIINLLKNFLNIPTEFLPETSVLREFIGNGYFE